MAKPEALLTAIQDVAGPNGELTIGLEEVNGQTYRVWKKGPQTLRELYDTAPYSRESDFLIFGSDRVSYGETLRRMKCIIHQLVHVYGVKKGDRVAVSMKNCPEWCISFMAITSLGAVAVPLNSWWTTSEMEYGLVDCGAKVLFADAERFKRAKPFLQKIGIQVIVCRIPHGLNLPQGVKEFKSVVQAGSNHNDLKLFPLDKFDLATIAYTSGTTGHPKGVVSSHFNILSAIMVLKFGALVMQRLNPPTQSEPHCILLPVPLFHATGLLSVFLGSFLFARKIVLMERWSAEIALELIEKERVTAFTGVPTMVLELLGSPSLSKRDVSSLRMVAGGGAPMPPKLPNQIISQMGAGPAQGYGLTETNALTTLNTAENYVKHPGSCGQAVVNIDLKVVDENGVTLGPNQPGELCIRGPSVMIGYWNKPAETAKVLKDGWFYSGDVAKIDDEGYVYILDRIKDLIIRGGENISCAEVEAAVYEHPAVAECAVFGIPHERLGEEVALAVLPKKGQTLTPELLKAHLKDRLAGFKIPSYIEIWNKPLPRGATGKIPKKDLREAVKSKQSKLQN